MTHRPIDDVSYAMTFYAALGLDVSYFAALWHTFNVGHILATDLDRICRQHGLSIADFNLLGALRIERPQHLRPTDLAATLEVTPAALSARLSKLEHDGLLALIEWSHRGSHWRGFWHRARMCDSFGRGHCKGCRLGYQQQKGGSLA